MRCRAAHSEQARCTVVHVDDREATQLQKHRQRMACATALPPSLTLNSQLPADTVLLEDAAP